MAFLPRSTICAVLLLLVACGKTDAPETSSSSAAQAASAPALPPSAVIVAPQTKSPTKTYEGPFGLAMGIQIKELEEELGFKKRSETTYTGTPPKPASSFEQYFISAAPSAGVCRIIATHDVKGVSGSGDQLKAATDSIAEMLEVKYGKPTEKFNFASQDVYKRNPKFWMMALMKEDVTYSYWWMKGKSFDPPNDISAITLEAQSSSIEDGYVRLTYIFSNEKACMDETKRQKSTNL